MRFTPLLKINSLVFCLLIFSGSMFAQKNRDEQVDIAKCWAYPLPDGGERASSDANHVFVGADGAKIDALSPDGKKIWSSEFGGEARSNMIAADSGLIVATSSVSLADEKVVGSRLRSISKDTGITNWTVSL